jgi:hypothetical protein
MNLYLLAHQTLVAQLQIFDLARKIIRFFI